MILLNFSHPLTPAQREQVVALVGELAMEIEMLVQVDLQKPIWPQVVALVDGLGLSPAKWQGESVVVNLPGLSVATAVLLAELHGRMGYFPTCLVLRRASDATPPVFEVAEVINLQNARDQARLRREERID